METLIYNILTFLIIAAAVFVVLKKWIMQLFSKNSNSCADGCGGCTASCQLRDVVQQQKSNQ